MKRVLEKPEQIAIENGGLKAYQSKIRITGQGWFLIRGIEKSGSFDLGPASPRYKHGNPLALIATDCKGFEES